jgi:hypothetical protein
VGARPAATATGLPVLLTGTSTYETAMQVHDLEVDLSADDLERAEQVMASSADALDGAWLADLLTRPEDRRLSPAAFRFSLTERARSVGARIVLPEGTEPRTLRAAAVCAERGIARPVLLAAPQAVQEAARSLGLVLPDAVEVVDPAAVAERYVAPLVERRRSKGWTDEVAREHLGDTIMLGTVMLRSTRSTGSWPGRSTRPPTRCGRRCRCWAPRRGAGSCRRSSSCACRTRCSSTATAPSTRSRPPPSSPTSRCRAPRRRGRSASSRASR